MYRAAIFFFILFAGRMLAQPVVSNRRMVNAANFAPQGLPNGSLARGAFFTIFRLQL